MSALKKILIGLGSIGAIGGTAATGYYLVKLRSPKNIEDQLLKEGLTPLDTSVVSTKDDTKWTTLIKKHLAPSNADKKIKNLNFSSGAERSPIPSDIAGIKSRCSNLLGTKVTSDEDFKTDLQNARDWCTSESEFLKE